MKKNMNNIHDKESDIVYRAKIGDEEFIFFVLLEFQSTVDYSMPIRLFFYISEILRREVDPEIIKAKNKNIKIPAVVPIVLYNGKKPRDAKEEVYTTKYITFEDANVDIFKYLESWYNIKNVRVKYYHSYMPKKRLESLE